jgi:predicted enzyme related to lactoylglutathione lyase
MLVLAVLLLAVPVYAADVDCSCVGSTDGSGLVTVKFTNNLTGDGNNVRAIALDISVDSGAAINKGSVAAVGGSGYWVYPGSIDINDTTGQVDNNGTPLCDPNYPGTQSGSNAMTVEMASLYEKGVESAPSQTNNSVLTFNVDKECVVTLAANTIRGGVVLEDPNNPVSPGYATCSPNGFDCYTGPDATRWAAMGEPNCWCWDKSVNPLAVPRQCRGDVDDANEGPLLNKPVLSNDLTVFLAGWNRRDGYLINPDNAVTVGGKTVLLICADLDHAPEGPLLNKGVLSNDLSIFLSYWNKRVANVPVCQ